MIIYRQGDILIKGTDSIPSEAQTVARENRLIILALGETTGHAHAIAAPGVKMLESNGMRYLDASTGFNLRHEEHGTITIPAGKYAVVRQREYTPEAIRQIAD